jgi:hypothetical protein
VTVSKIVETNEYIRFHVDRPGIPVVVKVSYFPAWKAVGARGPWRLAPNVMVVVPTSNDVRLEFRRTAVDWAGIGGSGAGVIGVVGLAASGRKRRRQVASLVTPVVVDDPSDQPLEPTSELEPTSDPVSASEPRSTSAE